MEVCENCLSIIGSQETPHVFNGNVVCSACASKLNDQANHPPTKTEHSKNKVRVQPTKQDPKKIMNNSTNELLSCKLCDKEVASNAYFCPNCGNVFNADAMRNTVVRGFDMPWNEMVLVVTKLSIAAIPAMFLSAIFWFILAVAFSGIIVGILTG